MTQHLVTELFHKWAGKPILVVGGGPSVNFDLPRLTTEPACVISANEHGFKQQFFKVDLVTNVDKIHCLEKRPMQEILRPFGVPIVNKHSWADYRLPDWTFNGNTGLTAIALAALLGANPVIVTGIDMWSGGRLYFHDPKGAKKEAKHRLVRKTISKRDRERIKPLKAFCAGAHVRPMSGPLTEWFKQYDPEEVLKPASPVGCRLRLEEETTPVYCESVRHFRMTAHDMVPPGRQLALSNFEYQTPAWQCAVKVLQSLSELK